MGRYEKNQLCLVMNFNENFKNEWTIVENQGAVFSKISHLFAIYCPRVTYFASDKNIILALI